MNISTNQNIPETKAKKLEPNEYGNFPCPYCKYILTAIVKTYIPEINEYICHHCQIKFEIKVKGGLLDFV